MNYPDPELDLRRNPRASTWPPPKKPSPRRRQVIGAVVAIGSVALFSAMLWYAYSFGKMTGSEETAPLIKADNTPTKIRPEQPGGLEIPDQNRVIFDRMNGREATVETLLSMPEEPVERPQADGSSSTSSADSSGDNSSEESLFPTVNDPEAATASSETANAESNPSSADAEPLAHVPIMPPLADTAVEEAKPLEPVPVERVAVITSKPVPGTVTSSKPTPASTKKPKPVAASKPVSPTASGGDRRIQVAAVGKEEDARKAVARLQQKFPNELGPLRFWINKVDIKDGAQGTKTFYRIQAGPVSETEAKSLCDKLKSKNLGCMLVK